MSPVKGRRRLGALVVAALAGAGGAGFVSGGAQAGAEAIPDPGAKGPLTVTRLDYDLGATAFRPTGFPGPVELTGSVYAPKTISGALPLVVLLHGRHGTCYSGGGEFLQWPCPRGSKPIPSYRGYDELSAVLASHGYVVASISANGINAVDNSDDDYGMSARAQLVQKHLDLWHQWATVGGAPFGTKFKGKVDLTRVGTMGHSRGGEGVVQNALLNATKPAPYGIKAVLPLAPVDFDRKVLNGLPIAVVLPYCDGDVSDLQGVHFYDDARYRVAADTAPKTYVTVYGANHNFFNTVWSPSSGIPGAADDWFYAGGDDPACGPRAASRLSEAQQRRVGLAVMAAFFRRYVGGETVFDPLFTGAASFGPFVGGADVRATHFAGRSRSLVVNRLQTSTERTTNTLGGAALVSGLTPGTLCSGASPQPATCLSSPGYADDPHQTNGFFGPPVPGASMLEGGWSKPTGSFSNDLPAAYRNVSGFAAFSFRVVGDIQDVRSKGKDMDATVSLVDGHGHRASVTVSSVSAALKRQPGATSGVVPKLLLGQARFPLSSFSGVDLTDVRTVTIAFDRTTTGDVELDDLAFTA